MTTHTKESLQRLTPAEALDILVKGNQRFVNNLKANRDLLQQMNATSEGQHPFAVILSCMDSRTSAELIFDQGLGDIFSVRIAGNFVSDNILGSIEFAAGVAGVKLILVLGHTGCGAIKGAIDDVRMGYLTGTLENLKPAVERTPREHAGTKPFDARVAETNVHIAIDDIVRKSDVVRGLLADGRIGIAGGMYDVGSGQVEFVHVGQGLEEVVEVSASAR
jgi:carbonic anhydrase